MHLTLTAQALYASVRYQTGDLVTPYEAAQARDEAVGRLGVDGVRVEAFRRAMVCVALAPEAHSDRFEWAEAAASLVDGRM